MAASSIPYGPSRRSDVPGARAKSDWRRRFAAEREALTRRLRGVPVSQRYAAAAILMRRLMFLHLLDAPGMEALHHRCERHTGSQAFYRLCLAPRFDTAPFVPAALDGADVDDPEVRRLLALFAEYDWHLGEAPAPPGAITADGLGTLFVEQPNRRETGAYYTPADVTAYIASRTIVPFVLDAAQSHDPAALSAAWQMLREEPDGYIPAAIRQREPLPTETPLETQARRGRYRRLRTLLRAGRITSVNELITHNLDVRRFAVAAIAKASPALAAGIAKTLASIRVLDPTCGAGDFLLAAFDVLAELGTACEARTSLRRSILERNLFGVDLMPEAVELCRLRLALKAATSTPPILDHSIRVGNAFDAWEAEAFDVIIGNPPYLAAGRTRQTSPVAAYRTAACPDVYAWILERSTQQLRPGGRCGMIVPLSLGFSSAFASCRQLLFERYGDNWFASFGRIPAALFAGDIRIRNTIHLGHKSDQPGHPFTTRLHRWFEAYRPHLLQTLEAGEHTQRAGSIGVR